MVFTYTSLRTIMKYSSNDVLQLNILLNRAIKAIKAPEMLVLRMNSEWTVAVDIFRHIHNLAIPDTDNVNEYQPDRESRKITYRHRYSCFC
jgi:hypothetical protein